MLLSNAALPLFHGDMQTYLNVEIGKILKNKVQIKVRKSQERIKRSISTINSIIAVYYYKKNHKYLLRCPNG